MKRSFAVLLALFLTAAACGGGEDEQPQDSGASEDEATNTVEITMQDYAYAVEGEPSVGPLTMTFRNEGEEIHHAILGKLDEGKTLADVQKTLDEGPEGPPPPWFDDSPLDMTLVSPGESSGITFDAQEGTYVLLCFMPGPDNKPHYEQGMSSSFEVAAGEGGAEPEPDAVLSMTEEGIEAPEGLTAGTSVVEVTNDGQIDLETFVVGLAEGKTLEDIEPYFQSGLKGPAPATFYGGTHTFPPGESAVLSFDLEPGDYQIVASYEDKSGEIQDLPTDFTVRE